MTNPTPDQAFDLEQVYDDQIAPLMTQIIDICKANKLPLFATFLYGHDPDNGGGQLCTTSLLFKEREIPPEMEELPATMGLVRRAPFRIRVTDKTGAVVEETVILS